MNDKKQEGPALIESCYGCKYLETTVGMLNLHHSCKKVHKSWQLGWHQFPDTPKECPFSKQVKI